MFYSFNPKVTFIRLEDFSFVLFPSREGALGQPKNETTSLWVVPFPSYLRALCLIFKDFSEPSRFAAGLVVMSDV